MSQVGIELFSCGAAITDGFPSVSCQRCRRYHSSNRCAKLSVCRRPNDSRVSARMGTHWWRIHASSAGRSAAVQLPTTAGIGRTTAGAAARRSAPPNAPARNHRSLGGSIECRVRATVLHSQGQQPQCILLRHCHFPARFINNVLLIDIEFVSQFGELDDDAHIAGE